MRAPSRRALHIPGGILAGLGLLGWLLLLEVWVDPDWTWHLHRLVTRASPVARLTRGYCFGFCPAYQLAVHDDGFVTFYGEGYVCRPGLHSRRMTSAELHAVRRELASVDFARLKAFYPPPFTDGPQVQLVYGFGLSQQAVTYTRGDRAVPRELVALADALDRLSEVDEWVGSRDARERAFGFPRHHPVPTSEELCSTD